MPIITNMEIFGNTLTGDIILEPTETCLCPKCQKGVLRVRARVRRHLKKQDTGEKEWYQIPLGQCDSDKCRRMCRMLPDSMAPFKHYEESTISKVLDGEITKEKNDVPSPQTMRRWAAWLVTNKNQIEAVIRSCGYKVFDYGEEYLFSAAPKLEELRREACNWLKYVLRLVYNSGGRLRAE